MISHDAISSRHKIKQHILLVFDDKTLGDSLRDLLEEYSYQVSWLRDSLSARDMLLQEKHGIDLAFVNFSLPKLSGVELIKSLRDQGITTPIIITSGYFDVEKECLAAGADAFLEKIFRIDNLLDMIKTLLSKDDT